MLPRVTFIFGGAASGKSEFAETLCEKSEMPMTYVATSQVLDDEFRTKIAIHKSRRRNRWHLIEEPFDLHDSLAGRPCGSVCLIDCATMWLTNHLMAGSDPESARDRLIAAIDSCPASLVIVSNEVGMGIVPDNALSRGFREAQGRLNITLAARADLAVFVAAGLPMVLKGTLP